MIMWAFLGGFAAVALAIYIIVMIVREKLRRFSQEAFGTKDVLHVLKQIDTQEAAPKSVRGCDRIIMPKILEDFPDFDVTMAKSYAKKYIKEQLASKEKMKIHKVVLSDYTEAESQKSILMQVSLAYKENGKTVQKRYNLRYSYLVDSAADAVATNCPNCGGALGYGISVCPYCGSRVVNIMKNTWQFTEMVEC